MSTYINFVLKKKHSNMKLLWISYSKSSDVFLTMSEEFNNLYTSSGDDMIKVELSNIQNIIRSLNGIINSTLTTLNIYHSYDKLSEAQFCDICQMEDYLCSVRSTLSKFEMIEMMMYDFEFSDFDELYVFND